MSTKQLVSIRQDHIDFSITVLKGRWASMLETELFLKLTCDYPFLEHIKAVEGGHGAYIKRVTLEAKKQLKKPHIT